MVEFRLLGPIELTSGEAHSIQSVLAQPKRVALLAYLALANPGAFCRRDTLLALFWPDSDDSRARRSLNQALYFLRRSLGDGLVVSRGDEEVGVDPALLSVDVLQLREALEVGDLERALSLYRGELMSGFHADTSHEFERWLDQERAAIREQIRVAAGTLAERSGGTPEAVAWARRSLEVAPDHHESLAMLMDQLVAVGDVRGALEAYETARSSLAADELLPPAEISARAEALRSRQDRVAAEAIRPLWGSSASPAAHTQPAAGARTGRGLRSARRGGLAAMVAGVIVLSVAALTIGRTGGSANGDGTYRVAVLPFETLGGPPGAQHVLADYATEWLVQQIALRRVAEVVPLEEVEALLPTGGEGRMDPNRLGEQLRADLIVTGRYRLSGARVEFSATLIDPMESRVRHTILPIGADTADPSAAVGELAERVAGRLALSRTGSQGVLDGHQPPRFSTWLAWKKGMDRYRQGDWAGAIEILRPAERQDSLWANLRFAVAVAYMNLREWAVVDSILERALAEHVPRTPNDDLALRWLAAQVAGDLLAAERASAEITRMRPLPWRYQTAYDAIMVGRYDSALVILRSIDTTGVWYNYWGRLTDVYHATGRHGDEMAAALQGRAKHPDNPSLARWIARSGGAVCDTVLLSSLFEERVATAPAAPGNAGVMAFWGARELRAHGCLQEGTDLAARGVEWYGTAGANLDQSETRRDYSLLLLMSRDYAGLYDLWAPVVEKEPENRFAIAWSGLAAAATGRTEIARDAARRVHALAERDIVGNDRTWESDRSWEAAIHAWLGDRELALRILRQAVTEGLHWIPMLHSDPRFEPLWGMRGFPPPGLAQGP